MLRLNLFSLSLLCVVWPLCCYCSEIYGSKITAAVNLRRNDSSKGNLERSLAPARSIHLGYVYDDADDVIHIIEPPQHFQALKRRQKQQQQQQQQHQPKPLLSPKNAPNIKVKEFPPHTALQNAANINSRRRRMPVGRDSLTQETQAEDVRLSPLAVKFPMEILASVRQTERILQQRHQQRPHAKQRIKTQRSHTVIMEQGYEKSHFKRGKEQRVGGGDDGGMYASAKATKRVRRDLKNDTQSRPQQAAPKSGPLSRLQDANVEQGAALLVRLGDLLKNATFYLPDDTDEAANDIVTPPQNSLLHELRTRFQQQGTPKKLIGEIEPTANELNNQPQPSATFVERDILQILENSLNATDALMQQIVRKNHNNKIDLKCSQQALLEGGGDSLQQYQSKIDCMRQQLDAVQRNSGLPPYPMKQLAPVSSTAATATATTSTSTTTARGHRRFGARSAYKLSPTASTTTTLAPAAAAATSTTTTQNQNFVAAIRQRQRFNKKSTEQFNNGNRHEPHSSIFKTKARKTATQLLDSRNVSAAAAALLYDDVMTNIRNMLEAKHLKLLVSKPEAASAKTAADDAFNSDHHNNDYNDDFIDVSSSLSPIAAVHAENHFRDLSFYLSGLQQMMSRLPHMTSTPDVPHELAHARNGQIVGNGALDTSTGNWYLINDDGKISEASYNVQPQSSQVIFHSFPDIPNAAFHLQTHATHRSSTNLNDERDFDFS